MWGQDAERAAQKPMRARAWERLVDDLVKVNKLNVVAQDEVDVRDVQARHALADARRDALGAEVERGVAVAANLGREHELPGAEDDGGFVSAVGAG